MQASGLEISVVCPCRDEEGNLELLTQRIRKALAGNCKSFEIILVDDGSADGTWLAIQKIAAHEKTVRGIRLSRGFGHQNALLAGLSQSQGAAIITLDSDLQHPPEVIPEMLTAWRHGAQIVSTRRRDQQVASPWKRWSSRLFYQFFSAIAGIEIKEGSSDFRLLDREALDILLRFAANDGFLRGSVEWMGFRAATINYEAAQRHAGDTKYSHAKMFRFAAKAITSFSDRPLQFSIWAGIFVGILALAELAYVVVIALSGETVPGWASTVGVMSFLFAILFVIVGIIGIYVSRIHAILKGRPAFIVIETTATRAGVKHREQILRKGARPN